MPRIVSKEAAAACLAHSLPSLSKEELKQLENLAMVLHFDADELVAQENAYFSGVYLVCQGLVYIGKYSPRTQEKRVLRFLAPGEWYGLEPFFLGRAQVNFQFARTIVESSLLFFDADTFRAFLDHHPRALQDLCRWFAREVAMLEFKLTREATESADRNLALLLLALSNKYGTPNADGSVFLELPLTRQTMAELLGVSVETLMRILRRFRERGYVQTRRSGLVIRSRQKLEELASTPELYLDIIEETL